MVDRRTDAHRSRRARDLGDAPRSSRVRTAVAPARGGTETGVPVVLDPMVDRPRVTSRFDVLRDDTVVLVDAPAGFGKTSACVQYAARQGRPVAWVTVAAGDELLSVLLAILHAIESSQRLPWVESGYGKHAPAAAIRSVLSHLHEPILIVIDDAHQLARSAEVLVPRLARIVPRGSQLLVIGRGGRSQSFDEPPLDAVARISADVLTMDREETATLLRGAGVPLSDDDVEGLLARTGGWPAALALASAAAAGAPDAATALAEFGGADRLVEDYVESEVLGELSPVERELLVSSSIADGLTGDECDSLLATTGSGRVLARLTLRLAPLVAMDEGSLSFRVNPLLREVLRAHLARRDVAHVGLVLGRASAWSERHDRIGDAIAFASEAGDRGRVAEVAWKAMGEAADGTRNDLMAWLARSDPARIADDPALCICSAWADAIRGDMAGTLRWLHLADRGGADAIMPDGSLLGGWRALLRAYLGRDGTHAMLRDAKRAALSVGLAAKPALGVTGYLQGCAHRLRGNTAAAQARFEAVIAGECPPMTRAHATAQLALLLAERGNRRDVGRLVSDASAQVARAGGQRTSPARLGARASLALLRAWTGSEVDARESIEAAHALLPTAGPSMPWMTADSHLLLAEALLELGDVRHARVELEDASLALKDYPDAGRLPERLAGLERQIERRRSSAPAGSRLTAAELRVLEYMPTHLTFPEIAEALFVSRHTVKTQAAAVYRKLGVASRSGAVDCARELGYLDSRRVEGRRRDG